MDSKYLAEIKAREQAAKDVLAKAELSYDAEYRPLLEAIFDISVLIAEVERQNQQIATLGKALGLACERNAEYAFCGGTDTMKKKHAEKNFQHFIQQAQEQEAHHAE